MYTWSLNGHENNICRKQIYIDLSCVYGNNPDVGHGTKFPELGWVLRKPGIQSVRKIVTVELSQLRVLVTSLAAGVGGTCICHRAVLLSTSFVTYITIQDIHI